MQEIRLWFCVRRALRNLCPASRREDAVKRHLEPVNANVFMQAMILFVILTGG
ncbi:MAG: hypothetical protein HY913_09040 [Desulfomonile tiedjei]|nr:hypothetical protein [Desulfomonile tiedjei]